MSEWTRATVVKDGGVVEVVLPELHGGEQVEVVVRREANGALTGKRAGYGNARGKIRMGDDFDAPVDDFKDYT